MAKVKVSYTFILKIAKSLSEIAARLVVLAGQLVNAIEEANGDTDADSG